MKKQEKVEKNPRAPVQVTEQKNQLSGVRVGEISSVDGGANQFADVILWKARSRKKSEAISQIRYEKALVELAKLWAPDPQRKGPIHFDQVEAVFAKLDEEPRTLDEVVEGRMVHAVDEALDARSSAFMSTTFGILMSDSDEKEELLLAAVTDFAALMQQDIPELLAGRLAKEFADEMLDTLSGDSAPTYSDVCKRAGMMLSLEGKRGNREMRTLTEKGKAALAKLSKSDREALAALTDEQTESLSKLAEKVEAGRDSGQLLKASVEKLATVEAENARLKKAITGAGDDPDIHPLLKGKTDEQRELIEPLIKHYDGLLSKSQTERDGLVLAMKDQAKVTKRAEFTTLAKSYSSLGTPVEELVDQFEKADAAGHLDALKKTLGAANKTAAKGIAQIGSDVDLETQGFGKSDERAEANAVVEKRAAELVTLSKGALSKEQAWVDAAAELPDEAALAAGVLS